MTGDHIAASPEHRCALCRRDDGRMLHQRGPGLVCNGCTRAFRRNVAPAMRRQAPWRSYR